MSLHAEVIAQVSGASLATYAVATRVVETVQQAISPAEVALSWWPLLAAVGVGLIAWGEIRQRVEAIERKTGEIGGVLDRLARIETRLDVLIEQQGGQYE